MLFNSVQFLIFLPIVALLYYLMPRKARSFWLLVVSYYFYMCWNPKYAVLIAISTVVTYFSGIGIEILRKKYPDRDKYAKCVVAASFVVNLGILIFFKYFNWLLGIAGTALHLSLESPFSFVLPVGISFYTFQALGYTMDIYRGKGKISAEKNIVRYALFVSFFPQLVAGPIERSGNLLTQIEYIKDKKIDCGEIRDGLCLMLYGFFLKLVIADRAAVLVDYVLEGYTYYGFVELTVAFVLFAIQILCDFNGYTVIARGAAQIFGIRLMDNFRQPYLATSIRDFWRRWHISLTSWFTDYLYIPLGGSRKGTVRKMFNTMVVFLVSGLWHGANGHFVIWGALHGIYQNMAIVIQSVKDRLGVRDKKMCFGTRLFKMMITFILVDIAWIFFRADSFGMALAYLKQMTTAYQNVSLLSLTFAWYDWLILIVAVGIMLTVDILHERGYKIRQWIYSEACGLGLRWIIYMAAFWSVLMLGVYGVAYDTSQFIYFQF